MTYDAASGLSVEWNHLNLIKKVSDGNGMLVNYSYLADGTKIRAVDADGEGLEYRGSLTFRRSSDGTLTPESIAFPGGRFVAMQGADGSIQMVPNYHIADHLGCVRTIAYSGPSRRSTTATPPMPSATTIRLILSIRMDGSLMCYGTSPASEWESVALSRILSQEMLVAL